MLKRVDYDEHQHAVYAKGRAMTEETLAGWMRTFAGHAPARRPLTVLDLGCGIGRFTPALAETFGGPVYGVEPSERMRAIAEESARHQGVRYLAGGAERIPLPDDSCDVVLLYLVIHHVRDRPAAAAEIARVLRPGGRLLLQNTFSDRVPPNMLWHHYFPGARAVERALFPTLAEVTEQFAAAGLRRIALEQVRHRLAASLADYAARLRLRAVSIFEYLPEEQIVAGLAALDADVAKDTDPRPVEGDVDLLVFAADEPSWR